MRFVPACGGEDDAFTCTSSSTEVAIGLSCADFSGVDFALVSIWSSTPVTDFCGVDVATAMMSESVLMSDVIGPSSGDSAITSSSQFGAGVGADLV